MFNDPEEFDLCAGPQRREPDQPEAWQRFLDERVPDLKSAQAAAP